MNGLGGKQHDLSQHDLTHCPSMMHAATLCWPSLVATETQLLLAGLVGALGARPLNLQARAREGPRGEAVDSSRTTELVL